MSEPLPVLYSTAAMLDLANKARDIAAARGKDFAVDYVTKLRSRIETLATSPKRYAERRRLGKGIRLRPELPYHVYYLVEPDHVSIVRVIHGRRRITRRTIEQSP